MKGNYCFEPNLLQTILDMRSKGVNFLRCVSEIYLSTTSVEIGREVLGERNIIHLINALKTNEVS